jgi:hypothetical protein
MKYCRLMNVSENFAVSFFKFDPEDGMCFVFLKFFYTLTRPHGITTQKTEILVLSFLELYIQMVGLTMTTRDQIASCMFGRGVWQSLSFQCFPFYFYSAAETYSRMRCLFCVSLSPFVRCEEAECGGRVGIFCRKQWQLVTEMSKWKEA